MNNASIVVPTKNAGSDFDQVLESLRDQDFSDIEIIVIDSSSTDQTVPIANRLADTVIEISPSDFHHGRTRNLGAANASNDIIVFTVQDARPVNRKWLPNLVSPIESDDADITYGNQVAYPDAKPVDKCF